MLQIRAVRRHMCKTQREMRIDASNTMIIFRDKTSITFLEE